MRTVDEDIRDLAELVGDIARASWSVLGTNEVVRVVNKASDVIAAVDQRLEESRRGRGGKS